MISNEQEAAEQDSRQIVGELHSALESLTEAVNRALEVMAGARAILARLEEPAVIRFDEALAAKKVRLAAESPARPHWNPVTRVLSLGDRIVKQFRVPAHNQEAVLSAFQEEGWPHRIDDPLPYRAGVRAKYRLHFTIGRLNQSEKDRLIRFFGDGTGEGVCWRLVEDTAQLLTGSTDSQPNKRRAA